MHECALRAYLQNKCTRLIALNCVYDHEITVGKYTSKQRPTLYRDHFLGAQNGDIYSQVLLYFAYI